jgi:acetylornithine/N-succinyldiaminopimelate aminotransferase
VKFNNQHRQYKFNSPTMNQPKLVPTSTQLKNDPRIAQAKELLLAAVRDHQQAIAGVKSADPALAESYKAMLEDFGKLRGGNLYFPYLSSGIGNGPYVELGDGSVKLDFITGIGVHGYGHSHPLLIKAGVDATISDTVMQGNLQQDANSYQLTKLLVDTACETGAELQHCILSTSGAMANENSLKIAFQKTYPANRVVAFSHCFAGRTLALCQVTDKAAYRDGMPDTIPVDYIPFFKQEQPAASTQSAVNHFKYLIKRYPGKISCLWLELIQGEGGYYAGSNEFFRSIIEVAKENKIAVIADEVQSFCRTSRPFAFQHFGLDKLVDIVTIGKISQACATLFTAEYKPRPGLISQTFTASSFSIIAGRAILQDLIDQGHFGPNGKNQQLHNHFVAGLQAIAEKHPGAIRGPYGEGMMIGFTPFDGSEAAAKQLVNHLFAAGLMSFMAGGNPTRVRFLIPLGCVELAHIDQACKILEQAITDLAPQFSGSPKS